MSLLSNLTRAQKVYNDLCAILEENDWKFSKDDDALTIHFTATGEDIPMDFVLKTDPGRQILSLYSKMPFTAPESQKDDMAVACCVAGNGLWDGSFDFDYESGEIMYRMTASFIGSDIGKGLFRYMIGMAGKVVDRYNDKLLAVCNGSMSLNDFIREENENKDS